MKKQTYCSRQCFIESVSKPKKECKNCGRQLTGKWAMDFCSRSCSASFNNKKRDYGYRRSKLEKYIEKEITSNTNTEVKFNDKSIIGSELDIYIPSKKLAIELNGIFHYEPVFGQQKFESIQRNDAEKKKRCKELDITLIEINTTEQKQFSIKSSKKFLKQVLDLIE